MNQLRSASPCIYRNSEIFVNWISGVAMEKVFVAQRVLGKLVETENTLDAAFAQSAELLGELLQARKDVNAPLTFADPVQAKLMEAIKSLSEARTAMVGVHNELTEAKLRL